MSRWRVTVFWMITAVSVAVLSVSAPPARAASVGSGACVSTVDNATGVSSSVNAAGACIVVFATAPTSPTTSAQYATRTWTVPAGITAVDVFVVAGGGGGGMSNCCTPTGGGGGGGGIVVATNFAVTPAATVTVKTGYGAQGGSCSPGYTGGDSGFGSLVAKGGGAGGGCGPAYGGPGGSAGGAHWGKELGVSNQQTSGTPSNGTTITSYGNNGGLSYPDGPSGSSDSASAGGGGGGGATGTGGNASQPGATSTGVGGNGGEGLANDWRTGSNTVYGAGGGGQGRGAQGTGGTNAGTGSGTNAAGGGGIDAVDETGAGGGAGYRQGGGRAGDGGSGVVIVRYFVDTAPANSAAPSVSGTARNGEILTGSAGTWTGYPTPSRTYKWKRASTASGAYSDIAGATSTTYTLTDDDVGRFVKFEVTATNASGSASALSSATAQVVDYPDGTVPTMSVATPATNGFSFTITNYSAGTAYTFLTTAGTVTRSGSAVTVSGLTAGSGATVTVRAAVSGYQTMSATVTGSSIAPTTTTAAPALEIVVTAPTTTVPPVGTSSQTTVVPVIRAAKDSTGTATGPTVPAVTTTTVAAAVTTTVVPAPRVPTVAAGQAAATVDGAEQNATVQRIDNQVVVTAGPINATVGVVGRDGNTAPLDGDGNVRLKEGDRIRIKVAGFEPGSEVEAWLFSVPTRLGTAKVTADGTVTATFTLPSATPVGAHRIAIVARTTDGKPATLALGIMVGEYDGGGGVAGWVIATPIAMAVLLAVFIPTTLRRRRRSVTRA